MTSNREPAEENQPAGGSGDGPPFEPTSILSILVRHRVKFVVIGGLAATAHGSPSVTQDLAICYERSRENLEALAAALKDLGVSLRGADPGLPFQIDWRTLQMGDSFTFSTLYGDFDCLSTPSGTDGFLDLAPRAVEYDLNGMVIQFAALDDLIRMKRAANRLKDQIELVILEALRQELDAQHQA